MSRDDATIEQLLTELADHIDWPQPPDLDLRVRRRLAHPHDRRRRIRWIPVTAVLVILVASLLILSPGARQAVADLLGVAGIEIRFLSEIGEPVGAELDLGEPVSMDDAAESIGFPLSSPESVGEPDDVYLSDRITGGVVTMVWEGEETLPAAGDTDVGLLYGQFDSDLDGERFVKGLGPDTGVGPVVVAGSAGFWIEGAPHLIAYVDGSGRRVEETTRLAGNVLVWERVGVTHRIETTQGLPEALRIAESVAPVSDPG